MIDSGHYSPPSLLSTDGFCEGLRLGEGNRRYAPLSNYKHLVDERGSIRNLELLYHPGDGELQGLSYLLSQQRLPVVPRLLRLRNTTEDVRLRQEGVKELVRNKALYAHIEQILADRDLVRHVDAGHASDTLSLHYNVTTDRVKEFLEKIAQIGDFKPKSECWQRAVEWAHTIKDDTLFREQYRSYKEKKDGRIIRLYDDRMRADRFYILKPGIRLEDIADALSGEITDFEEHYETRAGTKTRYRKIIKHRPKSDGGQVHDVPFSYAQQDLDTLNEITKGMVLEPMVYTHLQLQHLLQGAWLHHQWREHGHPSCFPEITDTGEFKATGLLPIAMVLGNISRRYKERLCPNDFDFPMQLIQAVGKNRGGKSEAWRTVNLLNTLANEGYPVPAKSCTYTVVPQSFFVHCKTGDHYGGSELEHNIKAILKQLPRLQPGDAVVLDELGDSANGPTALELAKRLLPPLLGHCSKVYVTSQHGAISRYVRQLGGLTLAPDDKARGINRFRLVKSHKMPDFRPGETLDSMESTTERVRQTLGCDEPLTPVMLEIKRRERAERRRHGEYDDEEDHPF